ncbi:hypothetical protein [Pseudomonas xantholysinigenes]|uniref:Uncharacterized protein n=1 Tax=Pseudomonas xantholysinigenes TaxID=2745490 RepID=A0A9E6TY81_9PSED|nr:hypothetical protein [Pseudomonas xantholysinigenes]QXI39322.1 hypothetical protein HU772_004360 [Pseudomonas xantholysinigenes]
MGFTVDAGPSYGFDTELKIYPGHSRGAFDPSIGERSGYQTDEILYTRTRTSISVVAPQEITEESGYQWQLGTAFYIEGLDRESPIVVAAYIVKDNRLHIGSAVTGTIKLEGNELTLSGYSFTARVSHTHQAQNVELKFTLPPK